MNKKNKGILSNHRLKHCKSEFVRFNSSPKKYGLLDPATSDGRVIFFLPWEGKTIVGTTDRKSPVTYSPKPSEDEIEFVLKETQKYLNPDVKGKRKIIKLTFQRHM